MSVRITTLENGLRIATDTMTQVETVSAGVWVGAGGRFESPLEVGVSHLLEHMTFKGTQKRTAQQIVEEIEDVGGHLNAYTTRETTAYYVKVLKEDTALAIDIIADLALNAVIDEDELKKERSVIIQEIHQSFDTPDDIVYDYFQDAAFPDQPLGRPVLGTADLIAQMPRDTVTAYLKRHYAPHNMVLSVAGNITHEEVVDLARTHFSGGKKNGVEVPAPAQYRGGDFREKRDLEQVHLLIGFEGVPYDADDIYAVSIFSSLFGGGMSSRLFQEVREKRGLVYSVYSYSSSYTDTGLFGIYAGTSKKDLGELIPVVADEINKAVESLSAEEVARARAQMKASTLMSLESPSGRAEQLARQMMVFGRPIPVSEIVEKIDAVDVDAALGAGRKIMGSTPTLTALGPIDDFETYECFSGRLG